MNKIVIDEHCCSLLASCGHFGELHGKRQTHRFEHVASSPFETAVGSFHVSCEINKSCSGKECLSV